MGILYACCDVDELFPDPQLLDLKGWLQGFLGEYGNTVSGDAEIDLNMPDETIEILFDTEHLQRIFSNLLDNALRHSRIATGRPSARVDVSWEHLSQRCLIDVIDQGLGITPTEQAKLFEPFYTTVDEGTGLGLYLCKELCEINNATLNYRPTAGDESFFRIAIRQRS